MTAKVPSGEEKRRQMNCHATPDLAARIEAFQRRMGITRSAAMCILLESALAQNGLPSPKE